MVSNFCNFKFYKLLYATVQNMYSKVFEYKVVGIYSTILRLLTILHMIS